MTIGGGGLQNAASRREDDGSRRRGATADGPLAAAGAKIAAAARRTPSGGCVMRKENEAGTKMDESKWGSLSAQMDQAHIKAERNGGLPQLGPSHITKEQILSFTESHYFSELMGQAHFNPKQVATCFMMLMGPNKFAVIPIRQWDPRGIYL